MASAVVIEKAFSFLYVQSSCWICVVHKGVRFRLGRSWVYRESHIFFSFGVCAVMHDGAGWSAISKVGLLCTWKIIGSMVLICWVGGVIICVDACVAWWLWLVICERVVRLFGWLFVGCSVCWITFCEFNATVSMIWVRGVFADCNVTNNVVLFYPF